VRPAAFLRRVHERFGDPVTIRTLWTDEPMVLFSGPDAVREVFRLDPAIAPAGQSWEFVRPFAGSHSILVLDGEEHLRERRLMQAPFHGERMRAFRPMVAELAERELGSWSGRVTTLERMKQLTLETILRVVFGARDDEAAGLRDAVHGTLDIVRSMPSMIAMSLVQRDLGPRSPWGRFRLAVEHFDDLLLGLVARRRAEPTGDSVLALLLEQRDADGNPPSDRHLRGRRSRSRRAGYSSRWRSAGKGSPQECTWSPASGSRCAARTSGRRRAHSGRSAGSRARLRRTRCRGSRSEAVCAAALERPSPRWRCARCCVRRER
jgi:cytochrome P450